MSSHSTAYHAACKHAGIEALSGVVDALNALEHDSNGALTIVGSSLAFFKGRLKDADVGPLVEAIHGKPPRSLDVSFHEVKDDGASALARIVSALVALDLRGNSVGTRARFLMVYISLDVACAVLLCCAVLCCAVLCVCVLRVFVLCMYAVLCVLCAVVCLCAVVLCCLCKYVCMCVCVCMCTCVRACCVRAVCVPICVLCVVCVFLSAPVVDLRAPVCVVRLSTCRYVCFVGRQVHQLRVRGFF
jgi:hypothetical protein